MKKWFILFLICILSLNFCGCYGQKDSAKTSTESEEHMKINEFDTEYVKLRNGLNKTYNKINSEKKLTVAYLGGSITAGAGADNPDKDSWRALITTWLKENFQGVEIVELNIGIGSTGSLLPSFYIDDYVIPKNPDLVFLEMAVNDFLDGSKIEEISIQYETIIRKLLTSNPSCEIVSLYTINDQLSVAEEYYPQAKAQDEIASYYGIPSANIGRKLKKEKGLIQSKINGVFSSKWLTYFVDEVHPTNLGHKEYADTIIYLLQSAFKLAEKSITIENIELPPPKNTNIILNSKFILATDLELLKTKGWNIVKTESTSGLRIEKSLHVVDPNNELNFTFEGSSLYFYCSTIPFDESGKLFKVSIDGSEWIQVGPSGAQPIIIIENLENTFHTVKFVAGGVGNNASSSIYQEFKLMAILVK